MLKTYTKKPTLETLQSDVGGYIELVELDNGDQLIVNEEGLLLSLPFNQNASALAGRRIVGNAVLLKGDALLD